VINRKKRHPERSLSPIENKKGKAWDVCARKSGKKKDSLLNNIKKPRQKKGRTIGKKGFTMCESTAKEGKKGENFL